MKTPEHPGRRETTPSYARVKTEHPKLHHKISGVTKRGMPRAVKEIRTGYIEPEKILPLEHSLYDIIRELRHILSAAEREKDRESAHAVQELLDDSLSCFEQVGLIREIGAMQESGNPLGYDAKLMEKAIELARQKLPLLAERIEMFSFPSAPRHAWNGVRSRFRPSMVVALAALGIALSPLEADSPGREIFSPLASHATLDEPEMHQQGTDPGRFERGQDVAHIQGNLPDFFVTKIYEFDEEGKRIPVPLAASSSGLIRGTISLPAAHYEQDVPTPLILPLGYVPKNVTTSPSVPFTLAPDYLAFSQHSRGPTHIQYEVAPTEKTPYALRKTRKELPVPALPELKKLLTDIALYPDNPEAAIHQYLQGFSYVVSSELQEMIDRIPGQMVYKTALIKAGDCDVLADHLAYALKKHIPAGVARGFWNGDNDNTLHTGEGHARLIYNTQNDILKAIETTDHPKRHLVNVTFLPDDRAQLEGKIKEIEQAPPKQKETRIREFGQTLENILRKDAYLLFRPKGSFVSALSRMREGERQASGEQKEDLRRQGEQAGGLPEGGASGKEQKTDGGLWEAIKNFQGFDDWKLNLGLIALLEALILAGVGITANMLYRKLKTHVRDSNVRKDIELFETLDRGDHTEENRKASKQMEAEFRHLCHEFSIPQEVTEKLRGEEREMIVLLHTIRDGQKFFLIAHLLASGRIKADMFRKTVTELAQSQEAVTREDILDTIREVYESEKTMHIAEVAQTQAVQRIWNLVRNHHLSQVESRTSEEQLGDILDTGPTVDGGKASRNPGSDEFYQLRPYQRGDDPRYMARKRSAADEPLVRELRAGMSGENKKSFHLVVDLPSVGDWEVANLMHLLALAYRKKINVHGIDLYAFGVPVRHFDTLALKKLVETTELNMDGFRKLVDVIVSGRTRESIQAASHYTGEVNRYSGSMIPTHIYEPISRDHSIVYLGNAHNGTNIRHVVRMKARQTPAVSSRSNE